MTASSPLPTPPGSPADAARRAAWQALSALFLDTELDHQDLQRLARQLRATGLPLAELERIYRDEVAPVCHLNLRVTAGAWQALDGPALQQAIEARWAAGRAGQPAGWWQRWRQRRQTALSDPDWERLRELLAGADAPASTRAT